MLGNLWIVFLDGEMRKNCFRTPLNSLPSLSAKVLCRTEEDIQPLVDLEGWEKVNVLCVTSILENEKWQAQEEVQPEETVTTEHQSTGASLSICAPPWCSPSPLADLSWITVTSQWGTGHLQQSQHLIKPSLPKSSLIQASSGTGPIRKATDRFLILFPFPPQD